MTATAFATFERSIVGGGLPLRDGDSSAVEEGTNSTLRLAFLGCEVRAPYGPYEHTATLFADLISSAWSQVLSPGQRRRLVLEVFAASQGELPSKDDLSNFDGVVLPGSFSSAYEDDTPWISALGDWIQSLLVKEEIPTLGVCFGHQLYAHSFRGDSVTGRAIKCPAGPQAGRKTTELTPCGQAFLDVARQSKRQDCSDEQQLAKPDSIACSDNALDMLYTHGDMVESLPPSGVSLGGNELVPIHSAVYLSSSSLESQDLAAVIRARGRSGDDHKNADSPRVIAVTFQAHPEMADLGRETKGEDTLSRCTKMMRDIGSLSKEEYEFALSDAETNCKQVTQQSLEAMVAAGRLLQWFP